MKVKVDQEKCIGCGTCVSMCPQCFEMRDDHKSHPKKDECTECNLKDVAASCPTDAIKVEKK